MKRKRTEITIETDRMLYFSSPRIVLGWCAVCNAQSAMASVDEAAVLWGVDSRTVFHWVDEGKLHFEETANGLLRICLQSFS